MTDARKLFVSMTAGSTPSAAVPLTMKALSYSSGVPNRYAVLGPLGEQVAEIRLKILNSAEVWKIRRNRRLNGSYKTAEEALSALQARIDAETLQ